MTTMHEEWTDRLSEYLDDGLTPDDRFAVESHLSGCDHCAAVLDDLRRVVARARALEPRPPALDLWPDVAARIEPMTRAAAVSPFPLKTRRTIVFTMPQLAAAATLLVALSGGLVWSVAGRRAAGTSPDAASTNAASTTQPADGAAGNEAAPADPTLAAINFADAQYDAAVAELQAAVHKGRGRLDASTITIVEHNLQIIDDAIEQARQALASDPANTYLSGHLVEARRRKLDLLRRTAALAAESTSD